MYSTCLFCNASLGANRVLEEFPVGRRLAFDAARGRLWVVCGRCERWNLTALEERWEVIEECERLFSGTRLRVSTEQVGLARMKEGLELVRIGEPQRPEMAAWRYGDQFGRRRRVALVRAGLGIGAFGAVVAGGLAVGIGIGMVGTSLGQLTRRIIDGSPDRVIAMLPSEGDMVKLRRKHLPGAKLVSGDRGGEWSLQIELKQRRLHYGGPEALRAAAQLLPALNRYGATARQVGSAVDFVERAGAPEAVFGSAAWLQRGTGAESLAKLPYTVRLALEMAAHEESERRALEGELAELERAWREAEEIAEISDSLLVPTAVEEWLRRLRGA